jgi:ubiquinone/menaquinone biosynthesis C-methylase UbiE
VELLDSGVLSPADIEANLSDLARLNRFLPGGTRASIAAIRRLLGTRRAASILDAGTGAGDMPIAFARAGWRTTAVDINPEVLSVAERRTARRGGIEIASADARALPFADAAFDVAHGSLLVHHLDPADAVVALRELARVSRLGVVINDLRRGALPLAATWISSVVLGRSHVTRRDGVASARRAYTLDELDALLAEAGLATRWRSPTWMPRVVTAAVTAAVTT